LRNEIIDETDLGTDTPSDSDNEAKARDSRRGAMTVDHGFRLAIGFIIWTVLILFSLLIYHQGLFVVVVNLAAIIASLGAAYLVGAGVEWIVKMKEKEKR